MNLKQAIFAFLYNTFNDKDFCMCIVLILFFFILINMHDLRITLDFQTYTFYCR